MQATSQPDIHLIERQSVSLDALNQLADSDRWAEHWLQFALTEMPELGAALLTLVNDREAMQPVALWPSPCPDARWLGDLVDDCLRCRKAIVAPPAANQSGCGVAYPVIADQKVHAVFACTFDFDDSRIESIMGQVEKVCLWLAVHLRQQHLSRAQSDAQQQAQVLDSILAMNKAESIKEVGLLWTDQLASVYACDRVCLGEVHSHDVKLQVVSGSSDHALNSAVTKKIRLAMQEACDQQRALCWPKPSDSAAIFLQLEKLAVSQNNAAIACVPVFVDQQSQLVLTFERPGSRPFTESELAALEAHLSLAGECYEAKRLADQSVWQLVKRRLGQQWQKLFGHGFVKRKVLALSLLAACLFFSVASGEYRISADAELEPDAIRVVSAPFSGYLKSAQARAGDQLHEGDLLLAMDDRDLRLEKIQAISQLSQANKQYTEALADGDRAQAQIFLAKVEQAKAQLAAADRDLQRAQVKAPYNALVVSGDLSQQIGAAINQGDELLRLSPMTDYRLIIYVSEFSIADVAQQQRGRVVFSSAPDHSFEFVVSRITPIAEVRDGATVFRVEATFANDNQFFRPGLVGVAKIDAGETLLIDMWTRNLRKWLALKLWSFWG